MSVYNKYNKHFIFAVLVIIIADTVIDKQTIYT